MNDLKVITLGKFQVLHNDTSPIDFHSGKVQELFCYLLLFRNYPHNREKLAQTLWEENSSEQSKCYLRRTLWQLQQTLDDYTEPCRPILLVESDWIQMNPEASVWLDVAELEDAYQKVKGLAGEILDGCSAQLLCEATNLYQGELLDGWYQSWCLSERERLQHLYLIMLDKLIRYYQVQGNIEAGIAYGRKILQYDRARECTHRQLMRLFYLGGDRSSALHQYKCCESALREELDVEPTKRTKLLYQQIRQDSVILPAQTRFRTDNVDGSEKALLHRISTELEGIKADLICLNQRVSHTSDIVISLIEEEDSKIDV